jgi:hypothetical protein
VLFLSDSAADRYSRIIHQPGLRIFGLVVAWNIVGLVLDPVWLRAVNLLYYPGVRYG